MRKIFAIFLVVVTLLCLTACDTVTSSNVEYGKKLIKNAGFVIIEQKYVKGDDSAYLVYDSKTKVEYLIFDGYHSLSVCPYYDENGNVAIYEGE
jgi:hypothetical protein